MPRFLLGHRQKALFRLVPVPENGERAPSLNGALDCLDHITTTTTTTITTGYLQKFQDGLQILAVRRNRSKKFLKSLMPAFLFLRIFEDSSYKSSSMKSVRAAATMFVSVARHHSAKHLHKCVQLLRFSISSKFKNVH